MDISEKAGYAHQEELVGIVVIVLFTLALLCLWKTWKTGVLLSKDRAAKRPFDPIILKEHRDSTRLLTIGSLILIVIILVECFKRTLPAELRVAEKWWLFGPHIMAASLFLLTLIAIASGVTGLRYPRIHRFLGTSTKVTFWVTFILGIIFILKQIYFLTSS